MELIRQKTNDFGNIMILSAWGFAIVISSFLFLYVGYQIDRLLNTAPSFMFGLFLLAIMLCVGRLYRDAWMMRSGKR